MGILFSYTNIGVSLFKHFQFFIMLLGVIIVLLLSVGILFYQALLLSDLEKMLMKVQTVLKE